MVQTPATPALDPSRPEVSVVIPARNEAASLAACLESLVSQQGIGFEIIVVNDQSTDAYRRNRAIVFRSSDYRIRAVSRQAGSERITLCGWEPSPLKANGCSSPMPTPSISPARCATVSTKPKSSVPICSPIRLSRKSTAFGSAPSCPWFSRNSRVRIEPWM